MNKYLSLLKYEAKTIIRDPMNIYMCVFPMVILILSAFVFPIILKSFGPGKGVALQLTTLLLLIIILVFGAFCLSAMATFLLLENKDECTLNTIAVTPIGASGYIMFKMTYIYIMSVITTIIVLLGTKLIAGGQYTIGGVSLFDNIGVIHIISFAVVSGLFVPALALFQGAFAKNKVEGFALIKGTGTVALIPALLILEAFQGKLQYILGVFPNFWAVKGIMLELFPINNSANLSYSMYLLIGTVYSILMLVIVYRFFLKKAEY
jgi:fluoroquinolone transport system permease protein